MTNTTIPVDATVIAYILPFNLLIIGGINMGPTGFRGEYHIRHPKSHTIIDANGNPKTVWSRYDTAAENILVLTENQPLLNMKLLHDLYPDSTNKQIFQDMKELLTNQV